MHENAQFTIKLSSEIKKLEDNKLLNLKNTYSVKNGVESSSISSEIKSQIADWQAIMSGSEYGTRYVIYGKFLGERLPNGFLVNRVQLYIQNYDGPVTIGFSLVDVTIGSEPITDPYHPEADPRCTHRNKFTMNIVLQGLCDQLDDFCKTDASDVKVERASGLENISDAPLLITEEDYLMVSVIFAPANPVYTKIFDELNMLKFTPFVDELFVKRYGDDIRITHKGKSKIESLNSAYEGIFDGFDLDNVEKNLTEAPKDYIETEYEQTSLIPCESIYSRFYIS